MKKVIAILVISFLFLKCQSNDDGSSVDATVISTLKVDGVAFVPTTLQVDDVVATNDEGGLVFSLRKPATNQSLVVKIGYPLDSSLAPNGVYDFGIGETGTMLFASGAYTTSSAMYSLAGYTVQVTKLLGDSKYKLDFQNVQAVEINTGNIIIISGSCEGTFN